MISKILKAIILAIKKILPIPNTSFELCLPEPAPPNLSKYIQIEIKPDGRTISRRRQGRPGPEPPQTDQNVEQVKRHTSMALGTAWIVVFVEPYGLRLRQHVMGMYHKDRARQRSVWLYNKILSARGRFMKIARRRLRRDYSLKEEITSFKDWLVEIIPWGWLRACLGLKTSPYCFLCGVKELSSLSDSTLIRCPTPKCIGIYCFSCYNDLGNLCTICRNPIEYGDVSDISEEKDSSEEETNLKQIVVKKTKSKGKTKSKPKAKGKTSGNAETKPLIDSSEDNYDEDENYDEVLAKSKYYDEEDENQEVFDKAQPKKKTKLRARQKPQIDSLTDDSDGINDSVDEDKSKYYHEEDDDDEEYQSGNVEVRTLMFSHDRQGEEVHKLISSNRDNAQESIDIDCGVKGDTFYGTDVELYDSPSISSYQKLIQEERIIRDGLDFSYQYCKNLYKRQEMKCENDLKVMEATERKNALKKLMIDICPYTYVPKRIKDFASFQDFSEYDDFDQIIHSTPTQTNITIQEIENYSDNVTTSRSTHTTSTYSATIEDQLSIPMTIRKTDNSSPNSSSDWNFTPVIWPKLARERK